MKFGTLLLGIKAMTTLDSILKSRDITLLTKGQSSQSYGFSSSQVWIWELDHKEGWTPKNWWLWIVPEKTLENPLDCKEIKPVSPKGNQPWIFTERTDAESEAPVLWTPDVKSQLTRKVSDAGKDWGQEEKGTTEDERAGWHHHSMDVSLSKLHATVKANRAWHTAVHGVAKSWTPLNNWTTTTSCYNPVK